MKLYKFLQAYTSRFYTSIAHLITESHFVFTMTHLLNELNSSQVSTGGIGLWNGLVHLPP
jgi:hypothetical protein